MNSASHWCVQMMQTQRALGDVFSELSQKNPELREEFTYNSETQRVLCKNGETLLGEFNSISSNCWATLYLKFVSASAVLVSFGVIFLLDHRVYLTFMINFVR